MTTSPKVARKWMPEEDQRLRNILSNIEPGSDINWHHIASHIPGRNNKECRKRWIYALMPSLRKGPWNEQEDALLLEGVRLHGLKWPLVSQSVGTRQPDQCSRRWHESLNPNINHGRWSLFEDQILKEAVQTYGRRWTEIVERYFPNRTPIAAKKRYAQCYQQTKQPKPPRSDSEYESNDNGPGPASPIMVFKKEEPDTTSPLLWHIPDHSQGFPGQQQHIKTPSSSYGFPLTAPPCFHHSSPPLSTSVMSGPRGPLINHYPNPTTIETFTAPNTPHYSPTYSRDGSFSGISAASISGSSMTAPEYPVVSDTHMWHVPVSTVTETQSAYTGSPYLFSDQGYFKPSHGHYVTHEVPISR